jgi:hypothetical protein
MRPHNTIPALLQLGPIVDRSFGPKTALRVLINAMLLRRPQRRMRRLAPNTILIAR